MYLWGFKRLNRAERPRIAQVIRRCAFFIIMVLLLSCGQLAFAPKTSAEDITTLGLNVAFAAYGTEYYVHKDHPQASDDNEGTDIGLPWLTIGKANQTLRAGDTVYIREGTYQETLEPWYSGSEGNKITYMAYPGEEVVLQGDPSVNPRNGYVDFAIISIGWKFRGPTWGRKNYIVIDGFTLRRSTIVEGTSESTSLIIFIKGSHGVYDNYNEIRNCKLLRNPDNIRENGIGVSGSGYNIIENNYIDGFYGGIGMGIGTNNVIRNNHIINPFGNCIGIGSAKGQMHNYLIEGNTLCGSKTSDGIQFEHDYDLTNANIRDEDSNRGVVIRNNIICHNAENAIDLKGGAYVVIEGNIIYGNMGNNDGGWVRDDDGVMHPNLHNNRGGGHGGIMHGANGIVGSRDVIIRNNVLYDNLGAILGEKGYKIYNNSIMYNNRDYTGPNSIFENGRKPLFLGISWNKFKNISIKNNIIGGNNDCEVQDWYNEDHEVFYEPDYKDLYINNNLYFNPDGVKLVNLVGPGNWQPQLSFGEWVSFLVDVDWRITGDDVDSFVADPMFVNVPADLYGPPSEYNFNLQPDSPGIDSGMYLTKTLYQGSGTEIEVEDAGYFFDGYDVTDGDLIKVGSNVPVMITGIDYENNIITVDSSISWNQEDEVNLPFTGAGPDIGAYKYIGSGAPVLDPIGNRSVEEGTLLEITLTASDPNGDTLTYSVAPLPEGAAFIDNKFSWTPTHDDIGIHMVTFKVSDGEFVDTEEVTITVTETPAISIELNQDTWTLENMPLGDRNYNYDDTGTSPMHIITNTGDVPVGLDIGCIATRNIIHGAEQGLNTFMIAVGPDDTLIPPGGKAEIAVSIGIEEELPILLMFGAPTSLSGGIKSGDVIYDIRAYKAIK